MRWLDGITNSMLGNPGPEFRSQQSRHVSSMAVTEIPLVPTDTLIRGPDGQERGCNSNHNCTFPNQTFSSKKEQARGSLTPPIPLQPRPEPKGFPSPRKSATMGSIPGSGRSPGGGHDNPLQYSCLENPMNRRAWQTTVHGVAKSRTELKPLTTSPSFTARRQARLPHSRSLLLPGRER